MRLVPEAASCKESRSTFGPSVESKGAPWKLVTTSSFSQKLFRTPTPLESSRSFGALLCEL